MVMSAVMALTADWGRATEVPEDLSWAVVKKRLGNVGQFLNGLHDFMEEMRKDGIEEGLVEHVEKNFLSQKRFTREVVERRDYGAAALCDWCINTCKFFRIYRAVTPIREQLQQANAKIEELNTLMAANA